MSFGEGGQLQPGDEVRGEGDNVRPGLVGGEVEELQLAQPHVLQRLDPVLAPSPCPVPGGHGRGWMG